MRRYIIVGVILIIAITSVIAIFLFLKKNQVSTPTSFLQPSPTPDKLLSVVFANPQDRAINVSPTTQISIAFNKTPDVKEISFTSNPSFSFTTSSFDDVIILTPTGALSLNTHYSIKVSSPLLKSSYSFSFTTSLQKPQGSGIGPDARTVQRMDDQLRSAAPDAFLANNLPHEETTFAMTSYLNWTTGINGFIVALKGSDSARSKQDAISWMRSMELTDQQISTLTIAYVTSSVAELKNHLPYYGTYFGMLYEKGSDKTTVTILKRKRAEGDRELQSFLNSKGIQDKSEINNLTVEYL